MRWYLTTPPREFSEWLSLAISRDIPNVSLPTAEPEAAVIGDGWSILPLTDTPPSLGADETIDTRTIEHDGETAEVVYTVRAKTPEEIEASTPPPPIPSAPVMRAAAFGLGISNDDFTGLQSGFNIGGAMYMGPGEYLLFFNDPIEEPYVPLIFTSGSIAMDAIVTDAYSMMIEARDSGVLADPARFSIQVFQR